MDSPAEEIVIKKETEGFRFLKEHWDQLDGDYFFHDYEWNRIAADCRKSGELIFICFYRSGELYAILPLSKSDEKRYGVRCTYLGFCEPDHLFLHGIIGKKIISTKFQINDVRRVLNSAGVQYDFFKFKRVYGGEVDNLLHLNRSLFIRVNEQKSNIIDCSKGFDDYFQKLSKNRRQGLGKKYRRLERLGKLQTLISDSESRSHYLEQYLNLEKKSWKGSRGNAILNTESQTRFYREIAKLDETVVFLLVADTVVVASEIAIQSKDTLFVCKTSFDEAYAKYSPGELLLLETVKFACERKVGTVNLNTDLSWHAHLSNASRPLKSYEIYRKSPRCAVVLLIDWVVGTLKRLRGVRATLSVREQEPG
ncbi:MAG: GNAT family N-acetyltransferase [Candidatus Thiodiazotropha sp. (ex Monitilora ramsayi)]|nr:GNAT family N-acetyltransferase [Candidatus Thiodiazotropha sp. (ex Monitilora ramsayi)]